MGRAEKLAANCRNTVHVLRDMGSLRAVTYAWLAVPDGSIREVCEQGAREGAWGRRGAPHAQLVIHSAGAMGLDVLSSAKAPYALLGCAHPVRTIAEGDSDLSVDAWGVEASDPDADRVLRLLLSSAGARSVFHLPADRVRYHLACVIASNLVTVLVDEARRLARASGLPGGELDFPLARLARAAAEASEGGDAAGALTGPAVRGDAETVKSHVAALRDDSALRNVYRLLTARAVAMGERAGRLAPESAASVGKAIGVGI